MSMHTVCMTVLNQGLKSLGLGSRKRERNIRLIPDIITSYVFMHDMQYAVSDMEAVAVKSHFKENQHNRIN